MSSGFNSAIRIALKRAVAGRTSPLSAIPATIYGAFNISGVECSAGGYARISVANDTTTFPAAEPLVNGIALQWPVIPAGQAGITSVSFYDALTAGTELLRSADFGAVTLAANGILHLQASVLTFNITGF